MSKIFFAKDEVHGYGFYLEDVHSVIPENKKEISEELYYQLLAANSEQEIGADSDGMPILLSKPILTTEQRLAEGEAAIQAALDHGAKRWGYDSVDRAASYLSSSVPQFKADAEALVHWRDAVWTWAIALRSKVQNDPKAIPETWESFVEQMPTLPTKPIL